MFCENCGAELPLIRNIPPSPYPGRQSPSQGISDEEITNAILTHCLDCGGEISPEDKFCQNCGANLSPMRKRLQLKSKAHQAEIASDQNQSSPPSPTEPIVCPSCGYINQPTEKYCQMCGLQLFEQTETAPSQTDTKHPPSKGISQQRSQLQVCPNCGEEITDPSDPFCKECGQFLGSNPEFYKQDRNIPPIDEPKDANIPPSDAATKLLTTEIQAKIVLIPSKTELSLPRGKHELILGRSDPNTGTIPDIDFNAYGGNTSGVSRRHARLTLKVNQIYIEDLNSTNHTYLNNQELEAGKLYLVQDGDEISCGRFRFIFSLLSSSMPTTSR